MNPIVTDDLESGDPFGISGGFRTYMDVIEVKLQTGNPTTQFRRGQLFVQRETLLGKDKFNVKIARMLRNLADSVEFEWEHLIEPKP